MELELKAAIVVFICFAMYAVVTLMVRLRNVLAAYESPTFSLYVAQKGHDRIPTRQHHIMQYGMAIGVWMVMAVSGLILLFSNA